MRQVDSLTVSVVVDNTTDMLSTRPAHVTSELRVLFAAGIQELTGERLCSAHHGLSLLVTARTDGQERTVLFDAGPDPYAIERNAQRMGLEFGKVEAAVLSHGHFDHAEGLQRAVQLIREQNGQRPVPLHLHPGVFVRRAIQLASGERLPMQNVPSAGSLSESGYLLVESSREEEILDEVFFLSGEIPRTSFERGMGNQVRQLPSGNWEPDPLVLDERFMLAHIRGKGLVIFTGCSHAGVVNICRHVQELFPATPLYALIGGLHLAGPNEDLIDATIAELKKFNLSVILPGHCTGWRAVHSLVRAFGEKAVDPLAVGTRQSL
jgi:7,8-dihydropterin-6-yl-methyl-4-(beta-D-ribofuranosyl)aminobenzene 5'-phosphate synthase